MRHCALEGASRRPVAPVTHAVVAGLARPLPVMLVGAQPERPSVAVPVVTLRQVECGADGCSAPPTRRCGVAAGGRQPVIMGKAGRGPGSARAVSPAPSWDSVGMSATAGPRRAC